MKCASAADGQQPTVGSASPALARADIFHPSRSPLGITWGAAGVGILRLLQTALAERLGAREYKEIGLPLLQREDGLHALIGDGVDHLLKVDLNGGGDVVLPPFSDLQYLDHIEASLPAGGLPLHPRVFIWSHCFLRENPARLLDYGEYRKCEIFSLHRDRTTASTAWRELNRTISDLFRDILAIAPLAGERPPLTLFPGAERTFCLELPLPGGPLQTIFASHMMQPGFPLEHGFDLLANYAFLSACFSQKLLTSVLLHHSSQGDIRVPPAVNPTLGVVAGARLGDLSVDVIERLGGKERIRFLPDSSLREGRQVLDGTTAVWLLVRETTGPGEYRWHVFDRNSGTPTTVCMTAGEAAETAVRCCEKQAEVMLLESQRRIVNVFDGSIAGGSRPRPADKLSGDSLVLALCCNADCIRIAADTHGFLAKLVTDAPTELRCSTCGGPTQYRVLFEREEKYTSFYRPTAAAGWQRDGPVSVASVHPTEKNTA